ncbi:phosphoribosylanthranilate isomerase [Bacillus sp. CRN 9]|uniref:phosphoribosylanthranilate isomerase n=1 Tax=Cytobacillus horneckiae TaxID=549687 RepID=UPI001561FF7B|nr:phosphoribosylanthranilate isomerase [Bacillus sp. CRN 9]
MKVKICGITDIKTAQFAIECGADALGFVFADSKRKVTVQQAKEIMEKLPTSILKVGVFVNETIQNMTAIASQAGLTTIQLHGDEPPEICRNLGVTGTIKTIKAFNVGAREDLRQVDGYGCDYYLLDSPRGRYRGGNGTAFDWTVLEGIQLIDKKVILAGGLTPENVAEAIRQTNPYMVDVSSGVETDGKKDHRKIKAFIEAAKSTVKEEVK